MEENKSNLNNGPWWKPGMEILSQVSTWIVVPIVCALILGKMLDTHFGTKPVLFLVCTGIGFLFTCYGMVQAIRGYMKKLQEVDNKKENTEKN